MEYTTRAVDIKNDERRREIIDFLRELGLGFDEDTEYTVVLERDGRIMGTGSFVGKVIKQVGIRKELQGEGAAALLVDALVKEMLARGEDHVFVYTRPVYEDIFTSIGFRTVAGVAPYVVLLEWGSFSIGKYIDRLREGRAFDPDKDTAAIVVNCNPFTLGHRHLIEKAAGENHGVYVFVVKEDRSLFSYNTRLELVKRGTEDLGNVRVLEGGDYIISSATFPAYFTRDTERVETQTVLDVEIFGKYIAPALGIRKRYVGEEPYCDVTNRYNRAMEKLLPSRGIEFIEVERKEIDGMPVSASTVRECIRDDRWDLLKKLVPETTLEFLLSEEACPVIKRIKTTHSRH
jgi:[citrate (pro-3S)-lyase] ligase